MTDTSSVANTHSTTEPYPVTVPPPEPSSLNGPGVDSAAPEEEEPYTIRCVCTYDDDDGNTVFCEKCETWQHIDCYYWLEDVPEIHVCEECFPRGIDRNTASERQRSLREQQSDGGGDRKSKRPGAKGQRKKTNNNVNSDKVNGSGGGGGAHHYHHRSESGAREQPPPKKAKTNHRASNSISSLVNIPAFPPDGRKRTATSMSPTKSSSPSIPLYSKEFLHLYDHDQGPVDMESNLFVNLPLAGDLASWVTDAAALSRVANGRSPQDIFTWADTGLHRSHWPALSVESVDDPGLEIDGVHPSWKILKTQDTVGKDEIVGELTGKIGHLRDYSLDPQNRWQELRHPEPFVFFHPQLPLYIDSRHEGSMLRYARRSCRPNVTMKTYITNEVEYHFCFVAKEEIPANAEITAMWYLDQQLFNTTNGLVKQESNDSAQDRPAICLSNVLANFGGCACEQPTTCLLANVDRRRHARGGGDSKPATNGKRVMKKPRRKPTLSPSASTSRAASEAAKHPDDDEADSRSASGSGQPGSRDLTPTHDGTGFGESELSTREKRKIAAAEKKFQQLEQDQAAAATHGRRRKRPSGPSSHQPGPMGGSVSGAGGGDRMLIDTAVGRPSSSSPSSAISPGTFTVGGARKVSGPKPMVPSPLRRMPYVDSAMQTDMESGADDDLPPASATSPQQQQKQQATPPRRANFVPLTQRLLRRCQADWTRYESSKTPPQSPSATTATHGTTPPSNNHKTEDVDMKDSESPTATISKDDARPSEPLEPASPHPSPPPPPPAPLALSKPPFPPPWPSTAAHNSRVPPSLKDLANGSGSGSGSGGHRPSSDLHVSLPPPSSTTVPVQASATSPGSATSALSPQSNEAGTQAPGAGITAPSPVKKKLSLGDYLIRRGTMTPTSEKPSPVMPPPPPSQQQPQQSDESNNNNKPDKPATADADNHNPSDNASDVTMQDAPPQPAASNLPSVTF